ncbi:MAG TPA: MarR family transcriptional regulator [Croceibacterium sp.]|jgi:MarR family transcriptional regulator for hemolysin
MSEPDEGEFAGWAARFGEFYPRGSRTELEFRFSRLLILAARRWSTYIDEVIRQRTGQPRSRWQTLAALAFSDGPIATIALADRMAVQWPSLIRTLNDLEAEGLVERRINPTDKRSRLVTITAKGLALFREVKAVLDPTRAALLEGFPGHELAAAERLLDRFFAVMANAGEP